MTNFMNDVGKLLRSIDLGKKPPRQDLKVLILGSGVVGGSVGGWLAQKSDHVMFFDRGEVAEALKRRGITLYPGSDPSQREQIKVHVIDDLEEARDVDVVAIAVKNYSLDPVARMVKDALGDRPIVVGFQNGIANQDILPRYFSKVVYGVVSYNAWMDDPGVIGYQKKGPLHLGTMFNERRDETAIVARVFDRGVETHVTSRLQDAVHCKIVINLTNSLTTLIGHGVREVSDPSIFQTLLSNLTWEGVRIVRAAGYREVKLGGMPPWALMWAGSTLPQDLTRGFFEKNVRKMVISSMAQDVIQRGSRDTELESINGYILHLADRHGLRAPFNRTVYKLCEREFAKESFVPLDVREVWSEVRAAMNDQR